MVVVRSATMALDEYNVASQTVSGELEFKRMESSCRTRVRMKKKSRNDKRSRFLAADPYASEASPFGKNDPPSVTVRAKSGHGVHWTTETLNIPCKVLTKSSSGHMLRHTSRRALAASKTAGRRAPQFKAGLHTQQQQHRVANARNPALLVSSLALASCVAYVGGRKIYNDAQSNKETVTVDSTFAPASQLKDQDTLHSLVWGSNRRVEFQEHFG